MPVHGCRLSSYRRSCVPLLLHFGNNLCVIREKGLNCSVLDVHRDVRLFAEFQFCSHEASCNMQGTIVSDLYTLSLIMQHCRQELSRE